MIGFISKTAIIKFTTKRYLTAPDVRYTIGDSKMGLDIKQPPDKHFDFFYVMVYYDSDDESGGTIEFEAQTVTSIDNKHQRPESEDLFYIATLAMKEINRQFHLEAAKRHFGFTEDVISFRKGKFTEDDLNYQINKLLNLRYPS